ncbi:uncharacterized protein L203_102341 [Cryptococcus depauperatus CBS 7841]|uniref:histone acetyltransferase n=1 Tax=Cryptococcus depauperatus CBS 7841 TaxID=1295531 RepID=A0A1E3IA71_9TREE|nr:hypothetical protein L203_04798 [Cryptococcus depauperatus CBS 7841]
MTSPVILRDDILKAFSNVPNTQALGVTVFGSEPKRTRNIFPHSESPPKCLEQEWLITLDSEVEQRKGGSVGQEGGMTVFAPREQTLNAHENFIVDIPDPFSGPKPKVLISAISAHLYTFPPASSSSSILYISKVDSSGYSPSSPSLPLTKLLVQSVFSHFLNRCPLLRIQLFARAQRQYLFANSADNKGKKVLGGAGLCKWWKGIYEDTANTWALDNKSHNKDKNQYSLRLAFILPGYEEQEAKTLLGAGRLPSEGLAWFYTPPFSTQAVPSLSTSSSLATLIPSFPDDPKTRFLEELVAENSCPPLPTDDKATEKTKKEREAAEDAHRRKFEHKVLQNVAAQDFWERMGFRQECASGDVTGFFTLESSPSSIEQDKKQVFAPSFSPDNALQEAASNPCLPQAIVSRLLTALTNLDFANLQLAIEGSSIWFTQTHSIVSGEIGETGWQQCIGRVEGKSHFKEDEETMKAIKREEVTILQPKKKKKTAK